MDKWLFILFFALQWTELKAQFTTTTKFIESEQIPFCFGAIIFDSLGYFFREYSCGCASGGYISYGLYTISNNKIRLQYSSIDSIHPIKTIIYSDKGVTDSTVHVRFFDRYDTEIKGPVIEYKSNLKSDPVFVGSYPTKKDSSGYIISSKNSGKLLLISLDRIGARTGEIPLTNRSMDIYFNLPAFYFYYSFIRFDEVKETQLLYKNNGIYTFDGRKKLFVDHRYIRRQ